MIKVDVISGFLGAGKTTLIKKLFDSEIKNEKVVIIENEFGEIGIDGTFLKDSGVQIKEINSGCICCSLVGDFSSSMKEVVSKYNPDRIVIEPSGVGKLSDIVNAIKKVDCDLKLNIVCCVVDAKKVKIQLRNFGEFLHNQIEYANSIVLAKVDLVDENTLQNSLEIIREINSHANIISTKISDLEANHLLKVLEEEKSLKDLMISEVEDEHECCHHHHDHENEECCCHDHEHHHDDECHDHDHDEDEECCHHHHDEEEHHHHDHHDEECHHHEHHDEDEECCCHHDHHHDHHHHHHDHDADEVFTSWGIETVKSISKDKLIEFLEFLKSEENIGIILRSKGILKAKDSDKWFYFDYVAGDYQIREGNPDYTGRIVVIGSKINTELIEEEFNKKAN